jgi:hypothetical protein
MINVMDMGFYIKMVKFYIKDTKKTIRCNLNIKYKFSKK